MSNDNFIPTLLYTKASENLEKEIEGELGIPDPEDENGKLPSND